MQNLVGGPKGLSSGHRGEVDTSCFIIFNSSSGPPAYPERCGSAPNAPKYVLVVGVFIWANWSIDSSLIFTPILPFSGSGQLFALIWGVIGNTPLCSR